MYYRAIVPFADLQDNKHYYNAGDIFPRAGYTADNARLKELAGSNNRMGYPLIKAYEPVKPQKDALAMDVQTEEMPEPKKDKRHKAPTKG